MLGFRTEKDKASEHLLTTCFCGMFFVEASKTRRNKRAYRVVCERVATPYCAAYTMNIASPKEKKRYSFSTAYL